MPRLKRPHSLRRAPTLSRIFSSAFRTRKCSWGDALSLPSLLRAAGTPWCGKRHPGGAARKISWVSACLVRGVAAAGVSHQVRQILIEKTVLGCRCQTTAFFLTQFPLPASDLCITRLLPLAKIGSLCAIRRARSRWEPVR